jgi:hypothetical protein
VGSGSTTAQMWFAGNYIAQGGTVDVAANNLASFWEEGGTVAGTDTLQVQAYDGVSWSAAQNITFTTVPQKASNVASGDGGTVITDPPPSLPGQELLWSLTPDAADAPSAVMRGQIGTVATTWNEAAPMGGLLWPGQYASYLAPGLGGTLTDSALTASTGSPLLAQPRQA